MQEAAAPFAPDQQEPSLGTVSPEDVVQQYMALTQQMTHIQQWVNFIQFQIKCNPISLQQQHQLQQQIQLQQPVISHQSMHQQQHLAATSQLQAQQHQMGHQQMPLSSMGANAGQMATTTQSHQLQQSIETQLRQEIISSTNQQAAAVAQQQEQSPAADFAGEQPNEAVQQTATTRVVESTSTNAGRSYDQHQVGIPSNNETPVLEQPQMGITTPSGDGQTDGRMMVQSKSEQGLEEPSTSTVPCQQPTEEVVPKPGPEASGDQPLFSRVRMPLTAFIYFSMKHQKRLRQDNPNVPHRDSMKLVGEMWHQFPVDAKAEFIEKARLDRERFNAEYKAETLKYGSPLPFPKKSRVTKQSAGLKDAKFLAFAEKRMVELMASEENQGKTQPELTAQIQSEWQEVQTTAAAFKATQQQENPMRNTGGGKRQDAVRLAMADFAAEADDGLLLSDEEMEGNPEDLLATDDMLPYYQGDKVGGATSGDLEGVADEQMTLIEPPQLMEGMLEMPPALDEAAEKDFDDSMLPPPLTEYSDD